MANPFGKISKEDIEPLDLGQKITKPFIGLCKLKSIDKEPIVGKGNTSYETLNFNFIFKIEEDGKVTPQDFRHCEFWPNDDDEEKRNKKGQNMMKRLAYMLKYYLGEDKAFQVVNEGWSDWDELRDRVIQSVAGRKLDDKSMMIKAPANPRSMRIELPRYIGFMAEPEGDRTLSWSKNEIEANNLYNAKLAGTAGASDTGTASAGSSSQSEPLQF